MTDASLFERAEGGLQTALEWLRLVIESIDAMVIAAGVFPSIWLPMSELRGESRSSDRAPTDVVPER